VAIRFEWDEQKNLSNQTKHGFSFEQAANVFQDPHIVFLEDRVIDYEERWQAIGIISGTFLLLVVHTERDDERGEVIRIISARRADSHERRIYEEKNG
jgi:uncharacterized protein